MYLEGEPNITTIGIGLHIDEVPKELVDTKMAGNLAFLVANSSRLEFEEKDFDRLGLEVVYSVQKPERRGFTHEWTSHGDYDVFYLFEVTVIPDPDPGSQN